MVCTRNASEAGIYFRQHFFDNVFFKSVHKFVGIKIEFNFKHFFTLRESHIMSKNIFQMQVKDEQPDLIKEARYALGELSKFTDTELLDQIEKFIDYWCESNRYKQDSKDESNPFLRPAENLCLD